MKPNMRPARPDFSSGPCAKRPGWTPEVLSDAAIGRSHRSKLGKKKIVEAVDRTRALLGIPADYRIGIVPASDTGAVEMALWSLLGARPVDMLAWESFGEGWVTDVAKQLKLKDARVLKAPYGQIADLQAVDWTHDVVFTWNGTTSGVKVPNGDWIAADREGLAICDATSAVFAMDLPWHKLDVVTWSWQKVMGGEGAHGMLVLSPRAVAAAGKLHAAVAAAEDLPPDLGRQVLRGDLQGRHDQHAVAALRRGRDRRPALGRERRRPEGADRALRGQSRACSRSSWPSASGSPSSPTTRRSAPTPRCASRSPRPGSRRSPADKQAAAAKKMADLLESEKAGYDVGSYRDAPPGLRIWCGATVETSRPRSAAALARLGLRRDRARVQAGARTPVPLMIAPLECALLA